MSQGIYLYCEATQQIVHVSESGGGGIRGADSPLAVGAFCQAHWGKALSIKSEWYTDEYAEWTDANVAQLYAAMEPADDLMLKKIKEAVEEKQVNEYMRGYYSAVADALEKHGPVPMVKELFAAGGNPEHAWPMHLDLFREHGLM